MVELNQLSAPGLVETSHRTLHQTSETTNTLPLDYRVFLGYKHWGDALYLTLYFPNYGIVVERYGTWHEMLI
mgnify:CR=1 FL=1